MGTDDNYCRHCGLHGPVRDDVLCTACWDAWVASHVPARDLGLRRSA